MGLKANIVGGLALLTASIAGTHYYEQVDSNNANQPPVEELQNLNVKVVRLSDEIKRRTVESLGLLTLDVPAVQATINKPATPAKISDTVMKAIIDATYHINSNKNSLTIGDEDDGCTIPSFGNRFQTTAKIKNGKLTFDTVLKGDKNFVLKTCTLDKDGEAI